MAALYCENCYTNKVDPTVDVNTLTLSSDEHICDSCGASAPIVITALQSAATIPKMTIAECQVETQKHIESVRKYIRFMIDKLDMRGVKHDASKLESPEVDAFAEVTPLLQETTYGSDEYNKHLEKLKPALEHHYAANRHHPQHFVNGINDMTLIDILEMFCDWKASTLRQNDGNLLKSIETNAERFNMDGQLKAILMNTARMLDEHED